jgi:hypothetical protein
MDISSLSGCMMHAEGVSEQKHFYQNKGYDACTSYIRAFQVNVFNIYAWRIYLPKRPNKSFVQCHKGTCNDVS